MYKGTIVENSLADKIILNQLQVIKTWKSDDWVLHDVLVKEEQFEQLKNSIAGGPWYMHFWIPGNKEIKVIFKDKIFSIDGTDNNTWTEAIAYGKTIGIPEEQLDFFIN